MSRPFIGIQISPISFIDEGVEGVLDTLQHRVGINVLLIGTISWLGLKVGRLVNLSEGTAPSFPMPVAFRADAAPTNIAPGEIVVRVDATAVYELSK